MNIFKSALFAFLVLGFFGASAKAGQITTETNSLTIAYELAVYHGSEESVNGMLKQHIDTPKFQWFSNGVKMNGEWVNILYAVATNRQNVWEMKFGPLDLEHQSKNWKEIYIEKVKDLNQKLGHYIEIITETTKLTEAYQTAILYDREVKVKEMLKDYMAGKQLFQNFSNDRKIIEYWDDMLYMVATNRQNDWEKKFGRLYIERRENEWKLLYLKQVKDLRTRLRSYVSNSPTAIGSIEKPGFSSGFDHWTTQD